MARTSACKSETCRAPIQWARNVESDKGIPLDPAPVADGNVIRVEDDDGRWSADVELRSGEWAVVVLGALELELLDPNVPRYQAHFRSCIDAEKFRTQRAGHGRNRRG